MNDDKVKFFNKVAKFPKNVKAKNAYNFLENIKISKKKLWYFIIERDNVSESQNSDLLVLKYNTLEGLDCSLFLNKLKEYYQQNEDFINIINNLIIEGNEKFSIIRNIPNVTINNIKVITIISEHVIKLLNNEKK
jgi:hypothetical protein